MKRQYATLTGAILLRLLGIVILFLALRYWWGTSVAILATIAGFSVAATSIVMRFWALGAAYGTAEKQYRLEPFEKALLIQGLTLSALLIAALVLRFYGLAIVFTVLVGLSFVLLKLLRRRKHATIG